MPLRNFRKKTFSHHFIPKYLIKRLSVLSRCGDEKDEWVESWINILIEGSSFGLKPREKKKNVDEELYFWLEPERFSSSRAPTYCFRSCDFDAVSFETVPFAKNLPILNSAPTDSLPCARVSRKLSIFNNFGRPRGAFRKLRICKIIA